VSISTDEASQSNASPRLGNKSPDDTPLIVECGEELPPTVGEIRSSESK